MRRDPRHCWAPNGRPVMCYHPVEILIVPSTQSSNSSARERRQSDCWPLGANRPETTENFSAARVISTSMAEPGPVTHRSIFCAGLLTSCVAADSISKFQLFTFQHKICQIDAAHGEPKHATRSTCGVQVDAPSCVTI